MHVLAGAWHCTSEGIGQILRVISLILQVLGMELHALNSLEVPGVSALAMIYSHLLALDLSLRKADTADL